MHFLTHVQCALSESALLGHISQMIQLHLIHLIIT